METPVLPAALGRPLGVRDALEGGVTLRCSGHLGGREERQAVLSFTAWVRMKLLLSLPARPSSSLLGPPASPCP